MTEENWISLFVGFGGVILGGAITYFSESRTRKFDRLRQNRNDFQVMMVASLDAVNGIFDALNAVTEAVVNPDGLMSSQMRLISNHSSEPIVVSVESLLSASDTEDPKLFSDVSLLVKRYNSGALAISELLKRKQKLNQVMAENGYIRSLQGEDLVQLAIPDEDNHTMIEFVSLERLSRETLKTTALNASFSLDVVKRIEISSKRKFKSNPPGFSIPKDAGIPSWIEELKDFSLT